MTQLIIVSYILSSTFYLHRVFALFFISVIQKLSVNLSMEVYLCLVLYIHDLRSQESEGLKGVYGLKSFHLAEN